MLLNFNLLFKLSPNKFIIKYCHLVTGWIHSSLWEHFNCSTLSRISSYWPSFTQVPPYKCALIPEEKKKKTLSPIKTKPDITSRNIRKQKKLLGKSLLEVEKKDEQLNTGRWGHYDTFITLWHGTSLPFFRSQNSADLLTLYGLVKLWHKLQLSPGECDCWLLLFCTAWVRKHSRQQVWPPSLISINTSVNQQN